MFSMILFEFSGLSFNATPRTVNLSLLYLLCTFTRLGISALQGGSYPVLQKKKEKRLESLYVFIIKTDEGVALEKRKEGLLKGMYGFPTAKKENSAIQVLQEWGVEDATIVEKASAVHIFTHVKWEMECVLVKAKSTPFETFTVQKIEEELSLPTAFSKAKKMMVKDV